MLILGIETATEQVSVAIGGHEGVLGLFEVCRGRRHAETLTPAIEFVCRQADIELGEISVIAVDVGPGLFTGMRVGLATGKALAQALRVPMIGMSSLDLLAFPLRHGSRSIVAVVDARRGELFYAFYRPVPGGVARETEAAVGPPEALAAELAASPEETLLVGNGALLYERQLVESGTPVEFASVAHAFPTAEALLELAVPRFHREEASRPEDVLPAYVRKSDAEINWSYRARSA